MLFRSKIGHDLNVAERLRAYQTNIRKVKEMFYDKQAKEGFDSSDNASCSFSPLASESYIIQIVLPFLVGKIDRRAYQFLVGTGPFFQDL